MDINQGGINYKMQAKSSNLGSKLGLNVNKSARKTMEDVADTT